mmetsp:Transcript_82603/g.184226  ORF Transcript_82603/g.184226 Transcript_82603/m.184226 type:complete len:92 (+) Transcript_82603:2-277(+)
MRRLREDFGADIMATVNMDQFEVPGICFPSDRTEFVRQLSMQEAGRHEDVRKASEAMRGKWAPAGLTPKQIREKFPWATWPEGTFGDPNQG